MNINYIMCSTLSSLLIIAVAFGLASSQTNTTEKSHTLPYFTCFSDICNRHGQDQFCSERERRCRNCQEIADDCLEPELPSNCTIWCINFHIQKALQNEKETACKDIGFIRNGNHNGSLTKPQVSGDVIAINCDPGYQISGSKTLECKVYGQWSHAFPTCQEIKCPVLPSVPNGRHNGSTTISNLVRDVVTVVCNHGYERIGPELTTCSTNGVWNAQLSVCQKIQCPLLHEVQNGKHNGSLRSLHVPGDIIVTSCGDLYLLLGTHSTVCNSQGFWTDPLPRCHVIECAPPPNIKNGNWSSVHHSQSPRFNVSQKVHATCNEGYNLRVPDTWECLMTGDWYSHDGLDVPVCVKDETNILMIVVGIESGIIVLVPISILLYHLYIRLSKQRYQYKNEKDQCKNDEMWIECGFKEEDSERVPLQAKPSPPRDISLNSQRLQREAQSEINRQRTAPPSMPHTNSTIDEFNDGINNCAEVDNSPINAEGPLNVPTGGFAVNASGQDRCEQQNIQGKMWQNSQREDPPNIPIGGSVYGASQRDRWEEQTTMGNRGQNRQREDPPNIPSGGSVYDASQRDGWEEQTTMGNRGQNRQREDAPNIPSAGSVYDASQRDRCEEEIIQRETGKNSQREDPSNIPPGSSAFSRSHRDRCEEHNIQGETGQNRQRGDPPNIPPERITININCNTNNSADNSNRLEYGNRTDSRSQVPKTDNSASQTPQPTQNEMDILKMEDEKSPTEESGNFQSSQPQTYDDLNTDDFNDCVSNEQCGGNEHQTKSLDVPPHSTNTAQEISRMSVVPSGVLHTADNEELGNANGCLITGLAVQQSANNEQDTARKLAMPNGDMNTDDINACVINGRLEGNGRQIDALPVAALGTMSTVVDEELRDNDSLINGLAIQQSVNNEQDTACILAMPNCDLKADDINAKV